MAQPSEPLLAHALRAGLAAWARRLGLLTLAFAAVAVANLPMQQAQELALDRVTEVSRRTEERGARVPGEQEALEDLTALGGACLGLCGAAAFGVTALMPLVAGASVLGARSVRGTARASDLLSGCRRYGPTLVATLVTALAGGGIAVAVATVDTLRLLGSASSAVGALVPPALAWAIGAGISAVTLWLCARLWFASIRVADPDRPRMGGVAAVSASWHWTEGTAQWQVLALMAIAACVAALASVPGALTGRVEADIVGAWVAVTLMLAVFGAAYERLAAMHEPIASPPQAPGGPAGGGDHGGMDA
jgi:hypothetical protein